MSNKKQVFAIIGSASNHSANERLIDYISQLTEDFFDLSIFTGLKTLPHFDPELSIGDPPPEVIDFRKNIENADGIIICTPEYIFSIPSGLKNAIEWCVSTTVFSDKPTGLITASASGQQGHKELMLIMKTVMARYTDQTTLLIQGIKGKINEQGHIADTKTINKLGQFIDAFRTLVLENEKTPVNKEK